MFNPNTYQYSNPQIPDTLARSFVPEYEVTITDSLDMVRVINATDTLSQQVSLRLIRDGWTGPWLPPVITPPVHWPPPPPPPLPKYPMICQCPQSVYVRDTIPAYSGGYSSFSNQEIEDITYYLYDHLGNTRVTYTEDDCGQLEISSFVDYDPYGKVLREAYWGDYKKYLTTQHERDWETGYDYRGARFYDSDIARFLSVDPLSKDLHSWSSYNYVVGNPVIYVDKNGKESQLVIVVFDKTTGTLSLVDLDHYKSGLPSVRVSAADYKMGGVRNEKGELTHNQYLVMENVFSGGRSINGDVARDPDSPYQRSIPNGKYDILDNNADTRHSGWFRLDARDNEPYNDTHDETGRDGLRWHVGSTSHGCVTCDKSQRSREEEWNVVTTILNNTTHHTAPERRGNQSWNPFSFLTKYGTMVVTGDDNIPLRKNE